MSYICFGHCRVLHRHTIGCWPERLEPGSGTKSEVADWGTRVCLSCSFPPGDGAWERTCRICLCRNPLVSPSSKASSSDTRLSLRSELWERIGRGTGRIVVPPRDVVNSYSVFLLSLYRSRAAYSSVAQKRLGRGVTGSGTGSIGIVGETRA